MTKTLARTSIILRNEPFGGIYFNQKNGKMAMIDNDGFNSILEYLSEENLTHSQKKFVNLFFEPDSRETVQVLFQPCNKVNIDSPIKTASPILINIALNNYCNLNCSYCYSLNEVNKEKKDLSLHDFDLLLSELVKNRVLQVALGGGEPTLHPDFIEILRRLRIEGSIIPNYTTNGTNLSSSILRATKEYCGAVALSYSQDRENLLFDALQKLIAHDIQVHLNVIMFKSQIPYLTKIVHKFVKLGVSNVILLLFKPVGRASNLLHELPDFKDIAPLNKELLNIYNLQKDYEFTLSIDACSSFIFKNFQVRPYSIGSCTSSFYSACIDYNLEMRPCSIMHHFKGIDLKKMSLRKAWDSIEFEKFRQTIVQTRDDNCMSCKHLTYCLGGCPIMPEIVFCDRGNK